MKGFAQCVTLAASCMFLGAGAACTGFLRGIQFRRLPAALAAVFRKEGQKKGGISSWEASASALAAAIGTGNITGVAGAIAIGGPGAIFWMWVSAFLGMATKYAEIALAVRYRDRGICGWLRAAGRHGETLRLLFGLFGAAAALGVGALVQSSALAQAVTEPMGRPGPAMGLMLGVGTAVITAVAVSSGAGGVAKVSAVLLPVMGGLYVLAALWVVLRNISALPEVLGEIVTSALGLRPAAGGAFFAALRCGVERGVFSNEAGLGSGALVHEMSSQSDPGREGLWGIFEVFADTILMCSLTAFAILLSGTETAMAAFSSVLGVWGGRIVVGCSVLFALSSLFPWCIYGKRCLETLTGREHGWYTALYLICAAAAPVLPAQRLWQASGILNALMAVPNLAAVLWHLRIDRKNAPAYTSE